jgi:hypothetical protein
MTVFESKMASSVRLNADTARTPLTGSQIGWTTAVAWPLVWIAVVAGALLGNSGHLLFWAGVVGVLAMFVRQAVRATHRSVSHANSVVDNALANIGIDEARIAEIEALRR